MLLRLLLLFLLGFLLLLLLFRVYGLGFVDDVAAVATDFVAVAASLVVAASADDDDANVALAIADVSLLLLPMMT